MKESLQKEIRVSIIENHQGTIDGYTYRLQAYPDIRIISSGMYADEFDNNSIQKTHV